MSALHAICWIVSVWFSVKWVSGIATWLRWEKLGDEKKFFKEPSVHDWHFLVALCAFFVAILS